MSPIHFVGLALVGISAAQVLPAAAQRGADQLSVPQLLEQLQPTTRGIRVPAQQPSGAAAPPEARPTASLATTAPAGMAAASLTVRFATGSATVTPEAARSLENLGRALTSPELMPYRFRIEGHTDTVGSGDSNQSLSERRAAAVRDHLAARFGVNPARLEVVGMGESQLLVATVDDAAEARNRRVQIVNLGN